MLGDKGTNKTNPKRRMLPTTSEIPCARSVRRSIRENAVLDQTDASCVARKATSRETAMPTLRTLRTSREVRDPNFIRPR